MSHRPGEYKSVLISSKAVERKGCGQKDYLTKQQNRELRNSLIHIWSSNLGQR